MNSNEKKNHRLGETYGKACAKLRKMLLYKYVCLAGDAICYRCGNKIDSIEDFSIEHKVAWLESKNPVKYFYDVDNIAFSHLKCNRLAAIRPIPAIKHGSSSGYQRGCRCGKCKEYKSMDNKKRRKHVKTD